MFTRDVDLAIPPQEFCPEDTDPGVCVCVGGIRGGTYARKVTATCSVQKFEGNRNSHRRGSD